MSNMPPTSPLDTTSSLGPKRQRSVGFAEESKSDGVYTITRSVRSNSDSSEDSSEAPRRARFAEATSVVSPTSGPGEGPFSDRNATSTPQPGDFGFGYIADNGPVEQHATVPTYLHPNGQPLKSALKTPGTASRLNPLSPTFKEEAMLDREEERTDKQQANDLKVKTRVRMAKMVLRGVNFSCSLIVLAMLSTTLTIFHASKNLPARNNAPAWAPNTSTWPQMLVLTIACISLLFSIIIILAYCRGGHRRAEKVAVYYTMFAVGYFIFSIVMWLVGAAVLQGTKASSNGTDLWGWSCKDNKRRQLFQDDVSYALVCRLQDWSLICCIIEIIVEIIVIAIYGIIFYRFYSKNKLRKSMDARDRARSDLYLAQLRSQSAPNTPGYAMTTPRNPYFPSVNDQKVDPHSRAEEGESPTQYVTVTPTSAQTSSPFRLQAPPIKSASRVQQDNFEPVTTTMSPPLERRNDHIEAAPGEQVYESVPIPGSYSAPYNQGHGQAY